MSVRGSIFLSLLLSLLSLVSTENQDEMRATCFEYGRSWNGFPLKRRDVNTNNYGAKPSAESCQRLCKQTRRCNWFNWNKHNRYCWLKTKKGRRGGNRNMVTGPKTCPASFFTGWKKVISTGRVSAISPFGNYVYAVGLDNYVWMYDLKGGRWYRRNTSLKVISVAVSGDYVYGVSQKDKAIYKLRCSPHICSTSWQAVTSGSVTSIAISGGYLYGVGLNMGVWSHAFRNGKWKKIFPGKVISIAVRNNYVYGVGRNKQVYVFRIGQTSKGWTKFISTGQVTDIAIHNNRMYGVGNDQQIYIYKDEL